MNLTIQHRELDQTSAVITLAGRLQLGPGCQQLEELVDSLVARGFNHLTFELAGVTHIDSTGMGRFIDAYSKVRNANGSVIMKGATGSVRDMFRVTRLDTILSFE
jgi:anti-sigma B factor antagonist